MTWQEERAPSPWALLAAPRPLSVPGQQALIHPGQTRLFTGGEPQTRGKEVSPSQHGQLLAWAVSPRAWLGAVPSHHRVTPGTRRGQGHFAGSVLRVRGQPQVPGCTHSPERGEGLAGGIVPWQQPGAVARAGQRGTAQASVHPSEPLVVLALQGTERRGKQGEVPGAGLGVQPLCRATLARHSPASSPPFCCISS